METLTRKAGFEALADVHNAINDAGHRFYYTGGGVLYIQTRGSKSQKHYAEKFSAFGEDILQILISDRDAVVRGVTKEDAFALIEEFSERYDAESNLSFSAIFLSPDDSKAFCWYGGRDGEKILNWTMRRWRYCNPVPRGPSLSPPPALAA
jgi:hypothetical protein